MLEQYAAQTARTADAEFNCLIICAISGMWLVLFCIANNWFEQDGEEDEPWDM